MPHRLVILLAGASIDATEPAFLALRYALTATAMDWEVELDVVGQAGVPLLRQGADRSASPGSRVPDLHVRLQEACGFGMRLYVCPAALAQAGMSPADLLPEVTGIRGAAALLASGFAPDARMITL